MRAIAGALILVVCTTSAVAGQRPAATVTEEVRVIPTYPFSGPSRIPILASDTRLYPYHRFEGYAHDPVDREWTVVHLENEWIEVWVLPEVGGKVWGARVKDTGHEFIYRNEVLKFRNIALRGPWTSGGIEFNFGVIGHTPATATPVDWATRENQDGSVSVFVGATDLPSRTNWRVEVRLPADRATFETRVRWNNPTVVEQPYYNWMTGAAFARDDLVMTIPGTAYLGHPGERHDWPVDEQGRRLSVYDENRFGSNKSFHVVGELDDFFGGYYLDADWGFGHWARHEEMPGQKLWLWALSRQGGIWEDLLTDTDGQYVEFQAGRLLVQYSPTGEVNPISEAGFDPGAFDRWTESWFPVEGIGGLTDASRDGVLAVRRSGDEAEISFQAFLRAADTLVVTAGENVVAAEPVALDVLEAVTRTVRVPEGTRLRIALPALGLSWDSAPGTRALDRPFVTDPEAMASIPATDRMVEEASELVQGRRLPRARALYTEALEHEPWNRDALLGMADLEYRRGRWDEGLTHVRRLLELDAYDADANFSAGRLYRASGDTLDARDAFGWSARAMAWRAVSYRQLAELALASGAFGESRRYAELAQDYDRPNPSGQRLLALLARLEGDQARARRTLDAMEMADPLDHFVRAERYLAGRDEVAAGTFRAALRSEYPEQEVLELVTSYARWGLGSDAVALVDAVPDLATHPLLRGWRAYLSGDPATVQGPVDPSFVFPWRVESIPVLEAAVEVGGHWSWSYLLALNLWARDRVEEAAGILAALGDDPDFAPLYTARAAVAALPEAADYRDTLDPESDLRRAVALDPDDRALRGPLVRWLQEEERFEDALAASGEARRRFPEDFDLALLHVASLVETTRFEAALEILEGLAVLPSENSGVAHVLFAQAHTQAGLDALEGGREAEAIEHFRAAMTWPEHLGQGRPYEPEERLQALLLGRALRAAGDREAAREAFLRVVAATPDAVLAGGGIDRLDLLGAAALDALDRAEELTSFGLGQQEGALARIAAAIRRNAGDLQSAGDVAGAMASAVTGSGAVFGDVEGRLIWRALTVEARTP